MKKIRAMGLATAMALALFAFAGAAMASASPGFLAGSYPAVVKGAGSGPDHVLRFKSSSLECVAPTFEAEVAAPGEALAATAMSSPSCSNGQTSTLKITGCKLIFHAEETAEIGPVGCSPMTVQPSANVNCKVSIGAQTGLPTTYQNLGSGSTATVEIDLQAESLEYSQAGSGCQNVGTFQDGDWIGSWVGSGESHGAQTSIRVGDLRTSFFVAGGGPGEGPAAFEAGEYPTAVLGSQDPADKLTLSVNDGTLQCEEVQLGRGLLAAQTSLPLAANLANCEAFNFTNVTVKMNSCQFQLHTLSGPPYTGQLGILCGGTDKIEVRSAGCLVSIGAQTNAGTLALENVGAGAEQSVAVDIAGGGVKYTETPKGFFPTCWPLSGGTYENGAFSGGLLLEGLNGGYIG